MYVCINIEKLQPIYGRSPFRWVQSPWIWCNSRGHFLVHSDGTTTAPLPILKNCNQSVDLLHSNRCEAHGSCVIQRVNFWYIRMEPQRACSQMHPNFTPKKLTTRLTSKYFSGLPIKLMSLMTICIHSN